MRHGLTTRFGYDEAFAEGIFEQIKGFGEYGFLESHAASFALLVYASGWLKYHEPEAFLGCHAQQSADGILFAVAACAGHSTS